MTRTLSLAHLTAINLSPLELVRMAAETGFDSVGLRLIRVTDASPGYPLMENRNMLRETKSELSASGLRVHDIEFVKIEPDFAIDPLKTFLDIGAQLGALEVITAPYDADLNRLADNLGVLSEEAWKRDLKVSLEFFPWTVVPDLKSAQQVVEQAGSEVGILVDSLHFNRSNSRIADLQETPSNRIRFAHICDAPVSPPYSKEDLLYAGREERLPPGEGWINLKEFVLALPEDIPLALEIPMTKLTQELGVEAVLRKVMNAAQLLLASLENAETEKEHTDTSKSEKLSAEG